MSSEICRKPKSCIANLWFAYEFFTLFLFAKKPRDNFNFEFALQTRLFVIVGLDPTIYFVLARAATSCYRGRN